MQLQKHLNRIVADKEYAKYLVVIPPEDVKKLQWKDGERLDHEIKDQALIIRKAESELSEEEALKVAAKYKPRKRRG